MNKRRHPATTAMSLAERAARIVDGFDKASPGEIADVLEEIMPQMKNQAVREYLAGKIEGVRSAGDAEGKDLCRNLKPYLFWAVQGDSP